MRVSHVTKFKETKSMQVEEGSVMPSTLQHHFPAGPDAADCWTSPRGRVIIDLAPVKQRRHLR